MQGELMNVRICGEFNKFSARASAQIPTKMQSILCRKRLRFLARGDRKRHKKESHQATLFRTKTNSLFTCLKQKKHKGKTALLIILRSAVKFYKELKFYCIFKHFHEILRLP